MNPKLWWYLARAGGIVAWALAALSVLWGLLLSTRVLSKRPAPAWLLDLHRFLGGTAVFFTGVHIAGLVADSYVHFGPAQILVPLASRWRPGAVAWGVVAFYLLVAVEVSSLAMRRIPRRLWKWIHASSYAVFVLGTVHGLTAGADAANPALQWTMLGATAAVVFLTTVRVLSPRSAAMRERRAATARVPARSASRSG